MKNKRWSPEEIDYLQDKWGMISIPSIAVHLDRTVNAIKIKAVKMKLGRHIHSGEEITLNQLFNAIGKGLSYGWLFNRWCRYGLPVKMKKSINKKYKVIEIEDFWNWAEKHKKLLDFSNFELNMLGKEPAWVEAKRQADIAASQYKKRPWTKEEDSTLISLLKVYKYSYREISEKLNRTEGAIKRRIFDLRLKQRPLRAENNRWTNEEIKQLIILKNNGCSPDVISERLGGRRSALAIRGKLERMELVVNNGEARRTICS